MAAPPIPITRTIPCGLAGAQPKGLNVCSDLARKVFARWKLRIFFDLHYANIVEIRELTVNA